MENDRINYDEITNQVLEPEYRMFVDDRAVIRHISNTLAVLLGWKNAEKTIGKAIFDAPHAILGSAEHFLFLHKRVFTRYPHVIVINAFEESIYLIETTSVKNDLEQCIGTVYRIVELSIFKMFHRYAHISKTNNHIPIIIKPSFREVFSDFTNREAEIIFLLLRGYKEKHIACIIGVSPRTIGTHISNIMFKRSCNSREKCIEEAYESGMCYFAPEGFFKSKYDDFIGLLDKKKHVMLDFKNRAVQLTKRQMETIRYLSVGRSPKEIACILDIEVRTVNTYIEQIKEKTGIKVRSKIIRNFLDFLS